MTNLAAVPSTAYAPSQELQDALRGPAQHHRLRIEPSALIEQAPQPTAVLAVLLDRVFVVYAGDQALVREEQQRHARGFGDAS